MTEQLITEIQRKMLPYLNNEQLMHLRDAMAETLEGATITYDGRSNSVAEETDAVEAFITAKRIEGCSEKTLSYYRKTIESLIAGVGKAVQQITTDDLRRYLTNYQVQRRSSKVTIDNIRRILSSFFSWLEDEDFILKSPVRRIHKVKTAKVVKDTYTDEALELMRDNCTTARDLAMIDLLASSGMRVGEMVMLNREDIDFNERECVVIGKGNKERTVYLNDACKSAVSAYMRVRPRDGVKDKALFLSSRNQRISPKTVQHMVYAYLDKAGLGDRGLSVHKLRHTAATLMYQNGHVDLLLLKEILGHENLGTTEIYTHIDRNMLRSEIIEHHPRNIKYRKEKEELFH